MMSWAILTVAQLSESPGHSSKPPALQRGGIQFLKFGKEVGDEIFFLEREGLE